MSIIRFFEFSHLPQGPMREVSSKFCQLAQEMDSLLQPGEEKEFALRKLLEAKDCAVRSTLLTLQTKKEAQTVFPEGEDLDAVVEEA